jgi:phosphopantothenate synthetase
MIPLDHPRYHSLKIRERLARYAKKGIVTPEGLAAHGRGEAFDYLIGEKTTQSALVAEQTAAAHISRSSLLTATQQHSQHMRSPPSRGQAERLLR